jgi:hypothetical protein
MSVGFPKIPTMAKTINISYKGESAVFGYKPIDRGVLYGKRRRVPFDADGNECAKASLLEDGSLLIKSGMTAQGYFTPDKVWVAQGDLEAINPDGSTPELFPATIGEVVEATQLSPVEALNLRFGTTYALEPEVLSEGIKKELDSGVVLTFPFNPRADYEVETGVLVRNENGYFALIGQKNQYEFVGLASVVSVAEEANSDTSDDLDFEMF